MTFIPSSPENCLFDSLLAKAMGSLELPNLRMYLHAAILLHSQDWAHYSECKVWVKIEQEMVAVPLSSVLWITPGYRPPKPSLPLLTSSTLQVWEAYCNRSMLSLRPNLMVPYFRTSPGDGPHFLVWQASGTPLE